MTQQIGVVGLAVMGKNLAWNIESRGYSVSVYNRSRQKTDEMVKESPGREIYPTYRPGGSAGRRERRYRCNHSKAVPAESHAYRFWRPSV